MSRIDHLLWHSLGTLRRFEEFIRTLVYGLDLWIYPKAALLLLIILLYYIIYLFIYLLSNSGGRIDFFCSSGTVFPCLSIFTGSRFMFNVCFIVL